MMLYCITEVRWLTKNLSFSSSQEPMETTFINNIYIRCNFTSLDWKIKMYVPNYARTSKISNNNHRFLLRKPLLLFTTTLQLEVLTIYSCAPTYPMNSFAEESTKPDFLNMSFPFGTPWEASTHNFSKAWLANCCWQGSWRWLCKTFLEY